MTLLAGALIAVKAAGASVGWGFQLQSPVVVSLLANAGVFLAATMIAQTFVHTL